MNVADSVVSEIMKHMPQGSEKNLMPSSGGYTLCIYWKLNNDQLRPNKYSKTIAIEIPRELIEDFPGYNTDMQASALEKIGQHIANKLNNFDPNHDSPRNFPPPTEHWNISVERLFG